MLTELTKRNKMEIYQDQVNLADKFEAFGRNMAEEEGSMTEEALSYLNHAEALRVKIGDQETWFVKHQPFVYEYIRPSIRRSYSWELNEYTFSDEMRDVMKEYPENGTDAEMDAYREKLIGTYENPVDYGVCDNAEQIWEKWPMLLTDERKFIILLSWVDAKENPGWRWRKNGPYIGTFDSMYEEIGDETGLDGVYSFQIIQVAE